ncbi:MAG TPA: M20 family metallopeptidase [Terriglobia bacterium]|jgi:glutamate carboxypeptidase|nr:M20 family metallopeptidase [Terriglobia bacterium]
MTQAFDPTPLLGWCTSDLDVLTDCLRRAVEIESPSGNRPAIDAMAQFFAAEIEAAGGRAQLLDHDRAGAAVVGEFPATARARTRDEGKPLLLLGHHDTVWETGTLVSMPFLLRAGLAYGPGIFDMKSGIVCALWGLRALGALAVPRGRPVRMFLNPDEEVASHAFRKRLQDEARRAAAVLVLEPAAAGGALKTARKGVGELRVTVRGRSAHAGINPAAGVNAITELARVILRVTELADPERGVTLTPGVISGGTRSNVVPETAQASIDVRVPSMADARRVERLVRAIKPADRRARVEIEGGINRPPLEHKRAAALYARARALALKMGFDLGEASTGGGSDGNFTAALGIPTLDGLGGVGDGAHARHEHVVVRELPRRAALLASLIATL